MSEIIVGSREIFNLSPKNKIFDLDNNISIPGSEKVKFESPFFLAKKALKLNEAKGLKEYYTKELFIDLLENNAIDTITYSRISACDFEILAGFVFESFISRRINSLTPIKAEILKWIYEDKINNLRLEDIKAIVVGGVTTKLDYPDLYSFSNPNIDILFINTIKEKYPPLIDSNNRYAGIQVKAVKTNIKKQIVEKIIGYRISTLNKKTDLTRHPIYPRVLTLLKDDSGKHTYDICKDIIYKDYKDILSSKDLEEAINNLASPERFGLDQKEIDYYYNLIKHWHAKPVDFEIKNLNVDNINSLMILDLYIREFNTGSRLKKHLIIPEF